VPPLEAFGLPTTTLVAERTTAYSFHYDADRRVMRQEAVGDPWTPQRALAAAGDADWVYVGALTRSDFSPVTLAALAAGGRRLLIDAHGVVRTPALGRLVTDGDSGGMLDAVTVLKLNDEEAETLVGSLEPEQLRALGVPEVLLTLGPRGSLVVTAELVERIAVKPVEGPVDPTGAGDTFSAAYLDARSRGADPVEAGRFASSFVAELLAA
jgi:sugar/nucleoside kinase (ribokinase family)